MFCNLKYFQRKVQGLENNLRLFLKYIYKKNILTRFHESVASNSAVNDILLYIYILKNKLKLTVQSHNSVPDNCCLYANIIIFFPNHSYKKNKLVQ